LSRLSGCFKQFERHSRKDAQRTVNLDFEARVPIPFSVFPSSYRSDAVSETTQTRVEGEVNFDRTSRVGREDTRIAASTALPDSRIYGKEEVDVRARSDDRRQPRRFEDQQTTVYEERVSNRHPEVQLTRERYQEPIGSTDRFDRTQRFDHTDRSDRTQRFDHKERFDRTERFDRNERFDRIEDRRPTYDKALESQLDITEREYRRRVDPTYEVDVTYDRRYQPQTEAYRADSYDLRDVDIEASRPRYSKPHTEAYRADSYRADSYDIREVDVDASRSRYPQPRTETYRADSYDLREVDINTPRPHYSAATEVSAPRPIELTVSQSAPVEPPTTTEVRVKESIREEVPPRKMGYYDDDGQYHSFRRGVERAADRILHPFHHHHEGKEEAIEGPARYREGVREEIRVVQPRGGHPPDTVPIPCHFIRIGDLLILQGRPCQVIRISVSPQTGQHRYLGVDLFTRQLHEESSFVSNPSPSVVVQTMLGPVYKTYRVLDIRDDASIVAMTETGDVKQGLSVVSQGHLFQRIREAFSDGRGSVRALVINDGGRELVVDYKVIHGSRL